MLSIGLNRAVDLLSRAQPGKTKGKSLGAHPADGKPVLLKAGRYGAYVEHGRLRATLPAGTDTETLDIERATALLAEKAGKATPQGNSKSQGKSKSGAGQKDRKRTKQTKPTGAAKAPARQRPAKSSTRS